MRGKEEHRPYFRALSLRPLGRTSTPLPLERQRAHPAPSPSRLLDFHKTVDRDASEPDQSRLERTHRQMGCPQVR